MGSPPAPSQRAGSEKLKLLNFGSPGPAVPRGPSPLSHRAPCTAPPVSAKSFTCGSLSALHCPCTAPQRKPQQSRGRLPYRGQCRPLVRTFLLGSIAGTRRTPGIDNDLTNKNKARSCWGCDHQLSLKNTK